MEAVCPESIGEVVVKDEIDRTGFTVTRSVGEIALAEGLPAELSAAL